MMPSKRLAKVLLLSLAMGIASTAAAQSNSTQPKLEVLTRQGDYYWVVETALDGSRKGGWVSARVPLDRIDRTALQPIPAVGPVQAAPPPVMAAAVPSAEVLTPDVLASRPLPDVQVHKAVAQAPVDQPAPQPANFKSSQTRSGFWFNGGMGFGSVGCQNCVGRVNGASGGISLGGTISDRVLLGVGTTGWYRSQDGVALSVGTLDARVRFYPSRTSGFFMNGGLGLGTVSLGVASVGSETEAGVGLMLGVGWDIRVASNVSLTPFYNGFAVRTANTDANVGQLGLGITVH